MLDALFHPSFSLFRTLTDFICHALVAPVDRTCKMEFAGVKSDCLRCFISLRSCPAFSSLARRTMNDFSSLAVDYSARYHWHSFPFLLLFAFFFSDKDARLVKLVVAVYEFFGEDTTQIEFTPADGRCPFFYISLCERKHERRKTKRKKSNILFYEARLKTFF